MMVEHMKIGDRFKKRGACEMQNELKEIINRLDCVTKINLADEYMVQDPNSSDMIAINEWLIDLHLTGNGADIEYKTHAHQNLESDEVYIQTTGGLKETLCINELLNCEIDVVELKKSILNKCLRESVHIEKALSDIRGLI